MSKKIKCAILTFALAAVVAVSAVLSACNIRTDHPRAKITVSFNKVDYEIEYQLYRNMYPQTVQHFIELTKAGFYDNMIVHNYGESSDWFTGAYSYNASSELTYEDAFTSGGGTLAEYLTYNDKEEEYYKLAADTKKITPTVYSQISYQNDKRFVEDKYMLPTLIGEFADNDHNIEKGALTAGKGSLKMFYYDKGDSNQKATIKTSFNEILEHDYKYNCATSIFSMQVGGSTFTEKSYCVFGELYNDKAVDALDDLIEAISDYITDRLGGSSSSFKNTSVTTTVDNLDTFAKEGGKSISQTFTMTQTPLIIKTVEITKY